MQPPKKALAFLRWFCREDYLEEIEGDLVEVFGKEVEISPRKAKWKFSWSVIKYFRPGFIKSFSFTNQYSPMGMYRSYFRIGWRNLLRNKGYSILNIGGLAIGLTAFILIALYVQHELGYDRFHEKADRIYRVNMEIKFGGNHMDLAVTNAIFGQTVKEYFPQVEQVTRLRWYGSLLVKKGDTNIREGNVAWADSTLFDVFSMKVLHGNPKTALSEPNSIVLTESVARKYFDRTDVVGQALTIDNDRERKITAVVEDLPSNSHVRFTSFVPMVEDNAATEVYWAGSQNWNTYLLLKPETNTYELVAEINSMLDKKLNPEFQTAINQSIYEFKQQGGIFEASLVNITDIHLSTPRTGDLYGTGSRQYIYMFSAIGLFILVIAVINFMNLATARSAKRAREVGVRKVMGSLRSSIMQQFLAESLLTCLFALLVSLGLAVLSLSFFNQLIGKELSLSGLNPAYVIAAMVGLLIFLGLFAGSYPAFYLSAFNPVTVLKGGNSAHSKKSLFRNSLVVFQFTASIMLIAGTLIVLMQMDYIGKKDLGYSREHVLVLSNVDQLGDKIETLKNSLSLVPGVEKMTVTGFLPVFYNRRFDTFFTNPNLDMRDAISMQAWTIDEDYIETMGISLAQGRNFVEGEPERKTVILNESAAKFIGLEDILEKKLFRLVGEDSDETEEFRVVGIVKDFNFSSLREEITPLAFFLGSDHGGIVMKVNSGDIQGLVSDVEREWKSVAGWLPFEYSFMDADFDKLYKNERRTATLIMVFAGISILISCMGLFGLATYMAEQRIKEVGIRKVMGASVAKIAALLSQDFIWLVLIAVVIATPLGYIFSIQWLEGFAYRIDLPWWVFGLSGMIAMGIALVTVSFQAVKAALMNPVKSLRSE